jgi:tetratricopeptide (TPR) repeat protein
MKRFFIGIIFLSLFSCKKIQEENSSLVINPENAVSYESSKDLLDKLIKDDPENSLLLFKRSQLYAQNGFNELALGDIEKAIKIEKTPKFFLLKAKILVEINDTTGLFDALNQVERSPIIDYEYYNLKANIENKRGQFRDALETVNKGIAIAPYFNDFYRLKGMAYLGLKDTLKGEKNLLFALEKDTTDANNYYELSALYQQTRQLDNSNKYLKRGLFEDSIHYGLTLLKAEQLHKLRFYDSALVYYNKSIRSNPKFEMAFEKRAIYYMHIFRYVAAAEDLHKVLRMNPNNKEALKNLAICQVENNELDHAETNFMKLYSADTSNVQIKRYLGIIKNLRQKLALNAIENATLHSDSISIKKDSIK